MESFLLGCSSIPPFPVVVRVDVVSSSARILSSFDSTPARKEPHLEVAFDAGGGDAISTTNIKFVQSVPYQTHAGVSHVSAGDY